MSDKLKGDRPVEVERSHVSDVGQSLDHEKGAKEQARQAKEAPDGEPEKKSFRSDIVLLVGIAAVILLFAVFFGYGYLANQERPQTVQEMHIANLEGELDPDLGFVYNDVYSFITLDDFWYTELVSPAGETLFNLAMRHSPREVDGMPIRGSLNVTKFDDAADYYVTFNPEGRDFPHVTLAVGEFNQHMASAFRKLPIAACDRNSTIQACEGRPVVTCDSTEKIVFYVNESETSSVVYDENCIVVSGTGFELTQGVDRVLYDLYHIIER